MKKGVTFGNIVYGYDFKRDPITGKKTKLVINEEEALIVKKIFNMYLNEGKGAYTIAKELKESNVKVKRPINKEESTDWREETILGMLKNVKYIGDLKQRITYTTDFLEHTKKFNKGEKEFIYIENTHEPIIDKETFIATQEEMERRSNMYKHDKSKYTNKHTFSGKLVCGCCGASYVAGENRKRKDGTIRKTWRCYTSTKYGKKHMQKEQEIGCDNERVNNEVLKECFLKAMREIVTNKNDIKKDVEEYVKMVINKCGNQTELNDILLKEKEKLCKEKNKLLDLCIKEIVDEETYKLKNKEIENKMAKLEKELEKQVQKVKIRDNIEEILENVKKSVDNILSLKKFSKNICKELVNKVVIHSDTKFDFYLNGYENPYIFEDKSNISYLQHS